MGTKTRRKDGKQAEERARRQQLKKRQIAHEPELGRPAPTKEMLRQLLIITEGKNTEPSYFSQFHQPTVHLVPVGVGDHTCSLVRRVAKIRNEEERAKNIIFNEVWVVFDKDDFSDFDDAINMAQAQGFRIAVSNQAIEYWLLLHFNDHQGGGLHRKRYASILNRHITPLGAHYHSRGKCVSPELFELLMSINPNTGLQRVKEAITRACRNNQNLPGGDSLSHHESCTTVCGLAKTILGMTASDDWDGCQGCKRCGAGPVSLE